MFSTALTVSNVRKASKYALAAAVGLAASACSSERVIARSSNEIVANATSSRGRFVWIADESQKPQPNLPAITTSAQEGIVEQTSIIESAANIIYNLPGVRDVTPFWAELLVWALIAVSCAGVVIIIIQTGIARMVGQLVARWLPKGSNA